MRPFVARAHIAPWKGKHLLDWFDITSSVTQEGVVAVSTSPSDKLGARTDGVPAMRCSCLRDDLGQVLVKSQSGQKCVPTGQVQKEPESDIMAGIDGMIVKVQWAVRSLRGGGRASPQWVRAHSADNE